MPDVREETFQFVVTVWVLFLNSCTYWIIKLPHGGRTQEWLFLNKTVISFLGEKPYILIGFWTCSQLKLDSKTAKSRKILSRLAKFLRVDNNNLLPQS